MPNGWGILEMALNSLAKEMIKGGIATYYLNLSEAKKIDGLIEHERMKLDAKAVVFGKEPGGSAGPTHDEKLAVMISKIDDLERRQKHYYKVASECEQSLGLNRLSYEERRLLDKVFNENKTYEIAGDLIGYSKTQVYRKMNRIYQKIYTNLGDH